MKEKFDSSFLADIKNYFLGIIAGLLSMVTIVAYFLNNIHDFFDVSYIYGYPIFVFIYFIFPILFSLFIYWYYYKKANVSSFYRLGSMFALPICVIIYVYLWLPVHYGISLAVLLLIIVSSILYSCYSIVKFNSIAKIKLNYSTNISLAEKNQKESSLIIKEFLALSLILFAAFSITAIRFKKDFSKISIDYSLDKQNICLNLLYNLNNREKKSLVKESSEKVDSALYKYQIAYAINKDSPYYIQSNEIFKTIKAKSLNTDTSFNNLYSAAQTINVSRSYKHENEQTAYLEIKALDISNKLLYNTLAGYTENELLDLIHSLQLRSFAWFYFLLTVSLILWTKKRLILNRNEFHDPQNEKNKKIQNEIAAIKTFICVLITLIIPFFKPVTENNVDIDKPFINLSLNNLLNGGEPSDSDAPINYGPFTDYSNANFIDNSVNYADSASVNKPTNDTLSRVYENTRTLYKVIYKIAEIDYDGLEVPTIKKYEDSLK